MIGVFNFIRTIPRPAQTQLHVGLPATQPNIAHQNFMQHDTLFRSDNFNRIRTTGRRRFHLRLPTTIRFSHCLRRPAIQLDAN